MKFSIDWEKKKKETVSWLEVEISAYAKIHPKKGLQRKVKERKSDQKTSEVIFLRKDEMNRP